MQERKGISSFSVLLLMAVTAVVGIACFSQLKVQYTPSASGQNVKVNFTYANASAETIESEVTSRVEAALANISYCTGISSISRPGSGSVSISLNKKADLQAVRFEVASRIRNIWNSLPDGCSYPTISLNARGEKNQTAIALNVRSPLPSKDIAKFIEDRVLYPLTTLEGVADVSFYGDTPYEWVITFDADRLSVCGFTVSNLETAISNWFSDTMLGMVKNGDSSFGVKLRSTRSSDEGDLARIPIGKSAGRIVYLGDLATFRYQEALPYSYYRINGLNTLELAVSSSPDANILNVVKEVKEKIARMQKSFPEEIAISVSYDYSEYIGDELDKIYFRTGLCLLILLLFVFLVNRSWRYMVVIALTLAVNILISVAIYALTGLHIHIYTLAGITVSLGIIIDNSIVMIDHWTRYRNRSVFPALLSAVLTTVAALLVILLLPETEKANLTDFTFVIVINLCVSLLVSYLFVPALLDYFPMEAGTVSHTPVRRLRRIVRWNNKYSRFIVWGTRHRWVFILVFIMAFGIPTCLIPDRSVKWEYYSQRRNSIDKYIGSSFWLFNKSLSGSKFYREPERESLSINAGMPEGCTVQQLDEVMRCMENYLTGIPEIEMFETSIGSARNGNITVLFKPEVENTMIPLQIKGEVIRMAADFGGANWRVSGLDDRYFNNNIITDRKYRGITLTGYNYADLIEYGEKLVAFLSTYRRVSGPEIWGGDYDDRPITEFSVDYDRETITAHGSSPYQYYRTLYSPLYSSYYGKYRLESSEKDNFDAWHVENVAVNVGQSKVKLSEVGSIQKKKTGIPIRRSKQSYEISVRYDFIGSSQLEERVMKEAINYMNDEVLPLGYRAGEGAFGYFIEHKEQFAALILLVIALIFVICAVQFNSLKYPVAIIWMIPISFIGLFLIFGLTDFCFDKGGFAAFVMLSGITVNAGIYLVTAWLGVDAGRSSVRSYIKSFNRKIWPISLTILSTVLGLVPFLFDGPSEVFWFPFAVGTISGLFFSVIAFVLYLPVFCLKRKS